jgi:hypothetical protein
MKGRVVKGDRLYDVLVVYDSWPDTPLWCDMERLKAAPIQLELFETEGK